MTTPPARFLVVSTPEHKEAARTKQKKTKKKEKKI